MSIDGVESDALNFASALSSYSSESATAITPDPFENKDLSCPAVAFQETGSRKVQPSNSTTASPPLVGP